MTLSVLIKTISLSLPVFLACEPSINMDMKFALDSIAATFSETTFAIWLINSRPL